MDHSDLILAMLCIHFLLQIKSNSIKISDFFSIWLSPPKGYNCSALTGYNMSQSDGQTERQTDGRTDGRTDKVRIIAYSALCN